MDRKIIHFQNANLYQDKINLFLREVLSTRKTSYIHSHNKGKLISDLTH